MIDWHTLAVFIPIALALNMTPGADMLFCLGQGMKSGPRAGIAASFGIATGSFIHALACGLGLAALVASHPIAFELIRWFGVAYLVWLAVLTFRTPPGSLRPGDTTRNSAALAWRNGTIVCLLNPKIAVFMLALVPQFVEPEQGSVLVQFLIFGAIMNVGGTVINASVGAFAGRINQTLSHNAAAIQVVRYISSCVFLGLAAKLAFEKR